MMRFLLALFIALFLTSCSPSRIVEPLPVGKRAIQFSTGGNFIDGKNSFTHPASSISIAILKGKDTNITSYSGIHISSFLYNYVHVEMGMLYGMRDYSLTKPWLPGLSVSFGLQLGTDMGEVIRAWPEASFNAYFKPFGDGTRLYTGFTNYFEVLNRVPEEKKENRHWLISPFIGLDYQFKTNGLYLKTEFRPVNYQINENFQEFGSFIYPGEIKNYALFIGLTMPF